MISLAALCSTENIERDKRDGMVNEKIEKWPILFSLFHTLIWKKKGGGVVSLTRG
jgi:hypothetical protein